MNLTASNLFLMCLAALVLAVVAVVIDRVNFPQKPFKAKLVKPAQRGPTKDRTGAHILEQTEESASRQ